jgi:hypothetical protein
VKTLKVGHGIELPLKLVTSTAAILATRGEGKTHIGKVLAEEMIAAGAHIIVGDPTGVWWGLQSSASGKRAGLPVVVFGGDHPDVPITPEMGTAVADAVVEDRLNAVLDMSAFEDDADKVRFMLGFAKRLYFINRKPVHIFLDEADEFVPQQVERAENKAKLLSIFKRIWQRGRVKGIGGTLISQRSAVVNKTLLNLSSLLIALKTVGPTDRDALARWAESYGTEEQQEEFNDTIGKMDQHVAWWFSSELGLFKKAKARALKTFDSSATPEVGEDLVKPTAKADVDLKRLGKTLAAAVEKVKADDPVLLRKQIDALQKELVEKRRRIVDTENQVIQIQKQPPKEKPIRFEVPILGARERKQLERVSKMQASIEAQISEAFSIAAGEILKAREEAGEIRRSVEVVRAAVARVEAAKRPLMPSRTDMASTASRMKPRKDWPKPEDVAPRRSFDPPDSNGDIGGASRRLLVALAQYGPLPPLRLRVLAQIGSIHTFRKYIGNHRAKDLVEGENPIELTRRGLDALGSYESLPTGGDLVAHWKSELSAGVLRDIFVFMLEHPERSFAVDELGPHVGTESVHTIRKYLGRLGTYGLVEKHKDGYQIASEFQNL